jgi:hypothetical protein
VAEFTLQLLARPLGAGQGIRHLPDLLTVWARQCTVLLRALLLHCLVTLLLLSCLAHHQPRAAKGKRGQTMDLATKVSHAAMRMR